MLGMNEINALRQAVVLCQEADQPEDDARSAQVQEVSDEETIQVAGENERASSSSSSTRPPGLPSSSSRTTPSSSSQAGQRRKTHIIKLEEDGAIIEAVYGNGNGEGNSSYCLVERVQGGARRTLGEIKLLVKPDRGDETFRALCKVHGKACSCWINRSGHCDLLLQWLASGHVQSFEKHALALRESIGMKTRR